MNSFDNTATERSLQFYTWWLTTLAWAATIFYFSTGTYGGSFTAWLVRQVLDFLGLTVSSHTFDIIHHLVRKAAHVTEYAMWGSLLYGSLGGGRDFGWRWQRAVICVVIAAAYSLSDEFHQTFVPGRGPSLVDCTIDTTGAALAMFLLWIRDRLLQAKARRIAEANARPAET